MAGTEVLTAQPHPFNYYNDPVLAISPSAGPLSGQTDERVLGYSLTTRTASC